MQTLITNIHSSKRGYLNRDFEFFHLKDQKSIHFEYHHHDFVKIIIFISGKVTYLIEGKAYRLKPWDILVIGNEEIHKPIIDSSEFYERIVIWINPAFIEKHNSSDCDLMTCFKLASKEKYYLLRPDAESLRNTRYILSQLELENSDKNNLFGWHILKNSILMQLVVYLNREYLYKGSAAKADLSDSDDLKYDENIEKILDYISSNLDSDLSIDNLSSQFYISKYYLMHMFKKQTGYSVYQYILYKRLILAGSLIKKGKSASQVCIECGFGDYSNFLRAFKKMYGIPPKEYYKSCLERKKEQSLHHFD
ncbi:MAG TPA: AraC family transcriptional regulator [Clostridiales bacterium]|nr:AraC family transcriptional regulator [Clostridiales bacterium]